MEEPFALTRPIYIIVVLTIVWCDLMADPQLFYLRYVKTRDLKVVAVSTLFLDGFIGRVLLDMLGSSTTFLIGAGFRVSIALLWLGVPGRNPASNMKEKLECQRRATKGYSETQFTLGNLL